MRTISSGAFLSISALEQSGALPTGYKIVPSGTNKAPGLIGEGFCGEALVCLLEGDNGDWFEQAAKAKEPEAWVERT